MTKTTNELKCLDGELNYGDESEFTYHQRQGFDNAFGVLRTALGILYLWGRKRIHISPETRV